MKYAILPVTQFQQNCSFLVCEDTGKLAICDPGGDIASIEAAIRELGAEPEKILVTHGHIDHAGAVAELARKLGIPVEGPHEDDRFWIDMLPQQSQMFGFPPAEAFTPDRWLHHGNTVTVGNLTLEVLHCPGHTPGHVVFWQPQAKLAVVGDVLFAGSIGRTDFPRGDHATLVSSIRERLFPLGDDVAFIPGHGPMSELGHERRTNPFVSDHRG
ncbi:metallo-beta-lactamase family protein [Isoalcanivorax pacificus W11-5]|uniref:Metallo-beta-lactamase family protein n=1 Tax=Isoalcanivorax pacificus W11-5 TaxID=391936 RepID=A0A0B4XU26_9GAMM|nr:MBL fold metallo-hydrolase [Isoalcanivorax pacificus]AJD49787.1 metallo-beta-lactamase family protein [Isoalcanivorax pacificus W11-5]